MTLNESVHLFETIIATGTRNAVQGTAYAVQGITSGLAVAGPTVSLYVKTDFSTFLISYWLNAIPDIYTHHKYRHRYYYEDEDSRSTNWRSGLRSLRRLRSGECWAS